MTGYYTWFMILQSGKFFSWRVAKRAKFEIGKARCVKFEMKNGRCANRKSTTLHTWWNSILALMRKYSSFYLYSAPNLYTDIQLLLKIVYEASLECINVCVGVDIRIFSFQVENVRLVDRHQNKKATSGTLYVTATHLIFVDPAGKCERWVSI